LKIKKIHDANEKGRFWERNYLKLKSLLIPPINSSIDFSGFVPDTFSINSNSYHG